MENKIKKRILFWCLSIIVLILYFLALTLFYPTKKATFFLQGAGALVQAAVAVLAIWGNQLRALLVGPKLVVELDNPKGQLTYYSEDKTPVRYFHLRIHNKRSGTPAINTQVILLSIVPPNKDGDRKKIPINGRLPFPWKFGQGIPYSIIGPDDYVDLGRLSKDGEFELQAAAWNLVKGYLRVGMNQRTTVEIMAIASNGQSNPLKLDIFWDGEWPESDDDVTRHVEIKRARNEAPK